MTEERREKLPTHLAKDDAKWLIIPSKIVLTGLCVWPETHTRFTKIVCVMFVLSSTFSISGSLYLVGEGEANLGSIAYSLTLLVASVEGVVRRILAYLYRERFKRLLTVVYFDFWPSDAVGRSVAKELAQDSWYLFVSWCIFNFFAVVTATEIAIFALARGYLPFRTAYPFEWKKSPNYECIYIFESFRVLEVCYTICGLDLFFISLLFNCIAQYKMLRVYFVTHFYEIMESGKNKTEEARKLTLACIKRHKELIGICEEMDQLFTYFIFINYMTSIFTVCLSTFVVTTVPENVAESCAYLLGHLCQLLIYCYMGSSLIIESSELANAVYHCGWNVFQTDTDLQKMLLMIMVRSQKPITITVGGFGILSLDSVLKLIQFSFSVYTLLSSMADK